MPNLSSRDLDILLLDRADDIAGCQSAITHPFRVQPQAHAIVTLADIRDVAHALEARKFILQLDRGIVTKVQIVAAIVGRKQIHNHQYAG